ncbi:M1 family metallopeptidase [Chloroflexales bacterium ZM16-3]|nr:M1 family metallopeptidase [Chloroflexales bacterium ZM16-3]
MITRTLTALLAFALLTGGCAPTAAPASASAVSSTEVPAAVSPTQAPAIAAARPTAAPTASPSATPEPPAEPALPPEVAVQAPALIPSAEGDLAGAGAWDRYTIIAALSPGELSVRGTVTLDMVNRYGVDLDQIYFHLYPNHPDFGGRLDVTSATVNGAQVHSGTQHGDTLLHLDLPAPLAPGESARVVLGFTARTPRGASDETFGAYNFEAGVWSMANFYPILARHTADIGWDTRPIVSRGDFTVSSVALYDVTIDAPNGWALLSTGVTISDGPVNEQVHRQRFVSGPQREFYLGALQGLAQAEAVVDGTRIVSYYQAKNPRAGQEGLAVAERSLRAFNQRYGSYPLAELEVVQSALTQFLGMEYPGVVLIEQKLYTEGGRGLETTIAHEIAHQWWYSQVGNDAQGEAWLDEGLASYSQVVYYEATGEPEKAAAELQFFRNTFRNARAAGRDAPLSSSPAQLSGGRYYPVIYAKGPLFFQALRDQLGEQGFDAFIHAYYSAFRYQDIVGDDLLRVAQDSCGCDLTQLYDDWVRTAAPVAIP